MANIILFLLVDSDYGTIDHCLVDIKNLPQYLLNRLMFTKKASDPNTVIQVNEEDFILLGEAAQQELTYPCVLLGQVYTELVTGDM